MDFSNFRERQNTGFGPSQPFHSPLAVGGDGQPGGVAVAGDDALVDGEHSADHHLLLLHVFVAAQVELGLQLAGGRRGTAAGVREETQAEQEASGSHPVVREESWSAGELCSRQAGRQAASADWLLLQGAAARLQVAGTIFWEVLIGAGGGKKKFSWDAEKISRGDAPV